MKYKDFITAVRGLMSEYRQALVEKTFECIAALSGVGKKVSRDTVLSLFTTEYFGAVERDSASEAILLDFEKHFDQHARAYVADA